jgi:hypothetical protein
MIRTSFLENITVTEAISNQILLKYDGNFIFKISSNITVVWFEIFMIKISLYMIHTSSLENITVTEAISNQILLKYDGNF